MEKLLLTPAEAAICLGIGRSKLHELLAAGVVGSIRIGNCRRVPIAALETFVASLEESDGRSSRGSVGPAA